MNSANNSSDPPPPAAARNHPGINRLETVGDICLCFQTNVFKELNVDITITQCPLVQHFTTRTLSPQVEELHQIKEVKQIIKSQFWDISRMIF